MAQVMEPEWQILDPGHQCRELVRETARLHRLAVGSATQKSAAILAHAEP